MIESNQVQLPHYRCHKEVWALKIKEIRVPQEPVFTGLVCRGCRTLGTACGDCERCRWSEDPRSKEYTIIPADQGYASFTVSIEYIQKHKPEGGGYYVVYKDGYKSYSPADAFEDGYTRI